MDRSPAPRPAGPPEARVEFVDAEPSRLTRPLALVDRRAYATTWLTVRLHRALPPPPSSPARPTLVVQPAAVAVAVAQEPGPHPVETPVEPLVETTTARRPYVVRDDGVVFGDGADHPIAALNLDASFPEPPRADRLWRRPALERFRAGHRPDPADVFARLAASYDAFVDFGRSLADQATMCRLCACCSLATWLADAFAVLPYLWLSGERGSGKTQLGTVWAMTSYLGETLLASTSYPTLRDLAQFGAALYFDDAEAVAGGRRGDPLKRELLLAGNRRGAQVALKVATPDGWRTRWVDAFTPRAFSAIALPDGTLGSRAIIIPLSRTRDPARGHRDPADPASWPCDRLALQDDLWALALSLLPAAADAWRALEAETALVGREFEKWRPLLAVARLLADRGLPDLEPRLRDVMLAYQHERLDLVAADETTDLVRGLVSMCEFGVSLQLTKKGHGAALSWMRQARLDVENQMLVSAVRQAVPEGDLARRNDRAAATRIGQLMVRLRFTRTRASGSDRARGWAVTLPRVLDLARAYGVPSLLFELFPDTSDTLDTSPTRPNDPS